MHLSFNNRMWEFFSFPDRVKMHTQRLDLANWVKIDRTYASQQCEKERLLRTKRNEIFVTNNDESTVLAKQELLELLSDYLPSIFSHCKSLLSICSEDK